MRTQRHKPLIIGVFIVYAVLCMPPPISAQPEVPEAYKKFIIHRVDRRSFSEKALNLIGMSGQDVGRSFALIAGVSHYPHMSGRHADLTPAAWDIANLTRYLQTHEFFDEIVVLTEQDVNFANLSYFLSSYFPQRLQKFPKSRFLFAYSGHGMTLDDKGFLLTAEATSLNDWPNSIPLEVVRSLFQQVVDTGYHVLALINSCYSGSFHRRPFGEDGRHYLPKHPGAHAITAGGTGELAWHDASVGKGSIFFEKFFAGLDGRADFIPKQPDGTSGDGIVTVDELSLYLRQEVSLFTNQEQNPNSDDLSRDRSNGGLFFLNRLRQVEQGVLPQWRPPQKLLAFGSESQTPPPSRIDDKEEVSSLPIPVSANVQPLPPLRIDDKEEVSSLPAQPESTTALPPIHSVAEFSTQTNSIGMEFIKIPASTFTMGSPDAGNVAYNDEKPAHQVTISQPFHMGKYEVTQAQWQAIMGDNPSRFKGDDNRPVENVSWDDVQRFIHKLNERERVTHYRLPTEAEWEYAARAGTTTLYSFGDDEAQLSAYAWYDENSGNITHPVGQKKPNPWGLYDMHGNVWEWVQDWHGPYAAGAMTDPTGPPEGESRVLRGGGWFDYGQLVRSAYRYRSVPGLRNDSYGFRLARGQENQ